MVTEEKHIQLIEKIKNLYVEDKKRQQHAQKMREKEFCAFCDELQNFYEQEKEVLNQHITLFISQYSFLNEKSSLQIINKHKQETYHSSFLEYLWGNKASFGCKAFYDFINDILTDKESWVDTIKQSSYKVFTEEYIKEQRKEGLNKKRIDLIFVDEKNKWCVIIENKIESKVHYSDNRSQLDNYFDYGKRKYKGFHQLYILLSHTDNQKHEKGEWKSANYHQVFKSLLKYHTEDSLLRDYLKTLFALLFPNEQMNNYSTHSLYQGMLFYNCIISKIK